MSLSVDMFLDPEGPAPEVLTLSGSGRPYEVIRLPGLTVYGRAMATDAEHADTFEAVAAAFFEAATRARSRVRSKGAKR